MRIFKVFATILLGLFGAAVASAATFTFQTSIPGNGGEVPVTVELTPVPGGDAVDVTVSIPPGSGDLLGFFGNLASSDLFTDEDLAPEMSVSDPAGQITASQFAANAVSQVGSGNNVHPVKKWDFGVRIGQPGQGSGAVESASFRLVAPGLTVATLTDAENHGWIFGVRLQGAGPGKIGLRADFPRLTVDAPVSGAFLNESPATITGAVSGTAVTVSVDGSPAAVSDGVFTGTSELLEGANTVTVTAVNGAGTTSESFEVLLDTVPPEVAIATPDDPTLTIDGEVIVTGTVNDASPILRVVSAGVEAEVDGGSFEITVPLALGANAVEIFAVDRAENFGATSVTVERGELAELSIAAPAAGSVLRVGEIEVFGLVSGADAVTVNGVPAALGGDAFSALVLLAEGANTLVATATNAFGSASATLEVVRRLPPEVAITSPAVMDRFSVSSVTVTGTVDTADVSVAVNGVPAQVAAGVFSVQLDLEEGNNLLTAVATDSDGEQGTATVVVSLDTTAPRLTIASPAAGSVVHDGTITVAGIVNDITAGSEAAEGELAVTVNGVGATVFNRYYSTELTVAPGANTLTAVATDGAGNSSQASVVVTFEQLAGQARIVQVDGDRQSGVVGGELPLPLRVRLVDAQGAPAPGRTVLFRVTSGDGVLIGNGQQARGVAVQSDAQGDAQVFWHLGNRAGVANQVVEAKAVRFVGPVTFSADALHGPAAQIFVGSGNRQVGVVGEPLPQPLAAVVTDASNNRRAGVPVTFTVIDGGGSLAGGAEVTATTDANGLAMAELGLGMREGADGNRVVADIPSNAGSPVTFVATGLVPGEPTATAIRGVVLDNLNEPIAGVTVSIDGTGLAAVTDGEGQFEIAPAPVGRVHLVADGSTADRPGTWPTLSYDMVTVGGRVNTIGMPVFLLPLDIENGILVDETSGGSLTLPELPGFALDVAPGSATFPDGSQSGLVTVTPVHADKIPMPPNFGQQPRLIVTIQPTGVRFDPPARLTLPNVEGLLPGEITELYSFDHDLGQFVSIGPATVSNDGLLIASNPGVGILEGGWHCGGNPSSSGSCCGDCGDCKKCNESQGKCLPKSGSCDDGKFCTSFDGSSPGPDQCENGTCKGKKVADRDRGDITPQEGDFTALRAILKGVAETANLAPGCQVGSPSISGSVKIGFFQRCCEAEQGFKLGEKFSGGLNVSITGVECLIPGASFSILGAFEVGVFAGVGLAGGVSASGDTDPCSGDCNWAVEGEIGVTISGGLKAILKLDPDLLSIKGSLNAGGKVSIQFACGEFSGNGCVGPPSLSGEATFAGFFKKSFSFVPFPTWKVCIN